jgi:hypothetical protein
MRINYQSIWQNHIFTNSDQKYIMLLPFDQGMFTLFPRDDIVDLRTIPNVTFTVCNRHEFHDLATFPTQVMA